MISVIMAGARDLVILKDLDLKTYHYPLSEEAWKYSLIDSPCRVFMAPIGTTNTSYMICEQEEGGALGIHRLGVLPKFQGLGVGKTLLRTAEETARDLHAMKLSMLIPECHCRDDADNVSRWLIWQGFRTVGVKTDHFKMYGDLYDGYIFERRVK